MFSRYYRSLCHYAFKYLGDDDLAEDTVQDTFVNIWQNSASFTDEISVKVFLYKTVRHKCLNRIKHQQVRDEKLKQLKFDEQLEDAFENEVIREETLGLFYKAIENLPKASKAVILLAIKGMNNEEIATQLNLSVNTVKTHKKTAYSLLRLQLKDVMPSAILLLDIIF